MIELSDEKKARIEAAFKAYWLSPFCTGTIEIGERLISWALNAKMLSSKAYADAYDHEKKIAYQIKTGLPTSPITFARLTTPSQFELVNQPHPQAIQSLGTELLNWVSTRIEEPKSILGASEVRIARIIYTRNGDFTYYERPTDLALFSPADYEWRWSLQGNALEGYRHGMKYFSWYPQGRQGTKNQNQLHYHGENRLIPKADAPNRHDFSLGDYARIDFDNLISVMLKLAEED